LSPSLVEYFHALILRLFLLLLLTVRLHTHYCKITHADYSTELPKAKKRKVEKKRKAEKDLDDATVSKTRYDGYHFKNPALRRYNATQMVARPPYMPHILPDFVIARQRAFEHIDLMPEEEGGSLSFIPPSSIFNNVGFKRVPQYTMMLLRLWPYILKRVTLARADTSVRPLTAGKWRSILGGEYWQNQWKASKDSDKFDLEKNFWRRGGLEIFGKTFNAQVVKGALPEFGLLHCGCVPTVKKVEANKALISEVVISLVQWEHLLQLAALASKSLKELGIPKIPKTEERDRDDLYVPDVDEFQSKGGVIKIIRKIVLGGQALSNSGWPKPYSGWQSRDDSDLRLKWLPFTRVFFLRHADEREMFER
jgi:hypothetical protein